MMEKVAGGRFWEVASQESHTHMYQPLQILYFYTNVKKNFTTVIFLQLLINNNI